ncbi:pentapeptide repeat-containing protein [Dendronalium sp. ChiSLP03b]|uniref:pentapeptide repeat-containing protein n=1 Tax=Dendronalium sp. ChiSLP03b TaxID=3075381 RepID=UPI00391D16B7
MESGAEITKASLEFAIALGVLATAPSAPVIAAGLSFVGIARSGLRLLRDKTNEKVEIAEWVAVACPLAYINSFNALVQRNVWLQERLNAEIAEQGVKVGLTQLGELELDNSEAKEALKQFSNSTLGQALNQQLFSYLQQAGIAENIASIVTGWVAWDTYNYIKELFLYESQDVHKDSNSLVTAAQEVRANEKYESIESYLTEHISPSPSDPLLVERWKVIGEEFQIPEIYVPLKAQLLDSNGKPKQKDTVDLESWVKEQLNKNHKNSQVMFIQAGPGRGKSVFCKMFANWVRENLHPIWTPILIRLRDIDTFEPNIENTLRAAVRENFANRDDWLSDRNTRYLFILDGFDELRFEGRTAKGIEDFLKQVGNYQAQTGCKHQFIVTGRESALHGIENRIPTNLDRVEIALMDEQIQTQWLEKWAKLFGQDKAEEFQKFLKADNCPERVKELAREPLLLYLLAAMHRDNELNIQMFEGANHAQAKIIIYQKTLDWVLTKQRPQELNRELTEFDTEDLRFILIEAGLCVTQSGREWTSIKAIEERLKNDKTARKMLEEAQKNLGETPLRNALAAFYLRPAKASESTEGAVEFIHKSFGEFLCAKKIKESFKKWVRLDPEIRRETFVIDDEKLSEEIYDLFGYSGLTEEIVGYLMALLDSEEKFQYLKLFERLEDFYIDWCEGKFIDGQKVKIFPFNQMQKFQALNISLGLREIDIYTGLHVMILLFELHRYAQNKDDLKDNIVFYPYGKKDSDNFDNNRLFRIIGYTNSIALGTFSATVGYFLYGANFTEANLTGANLTGANLTGANFTGANLTGANFDGANLAGANLLGANLIGINFMGASLNDASLKGASFNGANLNFASFERANIEKSNFKAANLTGANLSKAKLNESDFEGCDVQSVDFSEADLQDANFKKTHLWGVNFRGAVLKGTDFRGSYFTQIDFKEVDFNGANIEGVDFLRADLEGVNFSNSNLNGAKFNIVNFSRCSLVNVSLKRATFHRVEFIGISLEKANLSLADLSGGVDLRESNLESADLSGANLSSANLRGANLSNITWDKDTNWEDVRGLDKARNVPEALLAQLNSTSPPQDTPPSA